MPRMDGSVNLVYSVTVPAIRAIFDYTVRVIPHCDGVAVPLEAAHTLWQC